MYAPNRFRLKLWISSFFSSTFSPKKSYIISLRFKVNVISYQWSRYPYDSRRYDFITFNTLLFAATDGYGRVNARTDSLGLGRAVVREFSQRGARSRAKISRSIACSYVQLAAPVQLSRNSSLHRVQQEWVQ